MTPGAVPAVMVLLAPTHRPAALAAAGRALAWLSSQGLTVRLEPATALALDCAPTPETDLYPGADLAVVFGGDGSVVSAGRAAAAHGVPVIGVNFGTFGFLTEIDAEQLEPSLAALCQGRYAVDARLMLAARLADDGPSLLAANDVAVKATDPGRVLELRVSLDDDLIAEFPADGLLVATPTGSTAYNLSAGGPVVMPEVPALVLAPICPHTLATRPLVLSAAARLKIEVIDVPRMSHTAIVSLDGQVHHELGCGVSLHVARAATELRLARLHQGAFFRSLRGKLGWGLPK
jgi:NAD+ kinase